MVAVTDLKILPVFHAIQESVLTASRKSWGLFSPIRIGSAEQPRGLGPGSLYLASAVLSLGFFLPLPKFLSLSNPTATEASEF